MSKVYIIFSLIIPIAALIVGINFEPYILAVMMIIVEMIFSICLMVENKGLHRNC